MQSNHQDVIDGNDDSDADGDGDTVTRYALYQYILLYS